jgi:hypothetical protein
VVPHFCQTVLHFAHETGVSSDMVNLLERFFQTFPDLNYLRPLPLI